MENCASVRSSSCLIWLAAAFFVSALGHVQQGAGVVRPRHWQNSEAAVSVRPPGGASPRHFHSPIEPVAFIDGEHVEDKHGGSWLEQEAAEEVTPLLNSHTETPTQSPSAFRRLLRRLRFWRRGRTGGSDGGGEPPQTPRPSLPTRLFQHLRRAAAAIPAAASRFFRRFRRVQEPVFPPDEFPEDVDTNPMYFRGTDPGDVVIEELFNRIPETSVWNENERVLSNANHLVSTALWRNEQSFRVESELGERPRTLVRGPVLRDDGSYICLEATDQETGEPLEVHVPYFTERPPSNAIKQLSEQVLRLRLLRGIKNQRQAKAYLRFIFPIDLVKDPKKRKMIRVRLDERDMWVLSRFFLYPRMQSNLHILGDVLLSHSSTHKSLVHHARLQLTLQLIRLAASLQHYGLVHADFQVRNILLDQRGGVFLTGFEHLVRDGASAVSPIGRGFAPPETTAERMLPYRQHHPTLMTFPFDTWTLGLAIYWIWCADLPNTEDAELGGIEWIYRRCKNIPQPVRALLEGFLRYSKEDRLLPLQAMETSEYEQLRTELSAVLPLYQTDGEPA
ncbi:rhoptry protein ROP8 [Toxoplasma gondii GT1]|uniref:Rhoptry kinase family protein ROP2B (Incomplete catalytic triad) n=10 Tax=Toxoplasma gondii TaxID=5811 RepID=A0A0F7V3W0_TOXGV|nr:rhoptry protein ROP8 [Toxoplasma gondii GT1]CAA85377.1 ROP 2 [Toxoplasma gondii]CEL77146.1 TPA: Rhoptry kinase family protein ROP2B (incomplete catalytic triad) [Toxoplasma gondii VEG]